MFVGRISPKDRLKPVQDRNAAVEWRAHGGLKNREELKALAQRNGWTVRKLTLAEVRAMNPDHILYHETFNRENLEAALNEKKINAESEKLRVQQFYKEDIGRNPTPEQYEAANTFCRRFPQYVRNLENGRKLLAWMREHDLDSAKAENYEAAFRALANTELLLSPAALGLAGPDVIGAKNHPDRDDLLSDESEIKGRKKIAEMKRIKSLTSDEWKEETKHAWLDVDGIPSESWLKAHPEERGSVLGRMSQIFSDFMAQEPFYTPTNENAEIMCAYIKSQGYNFDLPNLNRAFKELAATKRIRVAKAIDTSQPQQHGETKVLDKKAILAKVARMNSDQIIAFWRDNPELEKVVNVG